MTDVTIIVGTYNRPEMLEVELHSILASAATVKPKGIETRIVVVDDSSPTLSAKAVAKKLGVDYVRLPENRGIAEVLHAGFQQVDTPYYALWGDDDYFLPRWFALHLAKIAEGFDVVAGSYWWADADLKPGKQETLPPATFAQLRKGKVACNDGSLVRRDAIGDVTWRPHLETAMMMGFWVDMAAKGASFAAIEEPTWLYRRHDNNLSARLRRDALRSDHDNAKRAEAIAAYA